MPYAIHARDGSGLVTLFRETKEAAEKKAAELAHMGCFEVEIVDATGSYQASTRADRSTSECAAVG